MDGGRHGYIKRNHTKGLVFLPARLFYADLMKDNIAKKLNIPLIRIDCFKSDVEYIKANIYDSELSEIINLDKIDWNHLEEICFKSIMVDVCNYRNEHPELFASDVAKIFDISNVSVREYWKQGAKMGLCNYDPKTEFHRRNTLPREWYQAVGVYVENLDTLENWEFKTKTDFCNSSENILDGDKMTKSMFEKRLAKTDENYIIYDSGIHEYLIWLSRQEDG